MLCSSCDGDIVINNLYRDKIIKKESAQYTACVYFKIVRKTIFQLILITNLKFVEKMISSARN